MERHQVSSLSSPPPPPAYNAGAALTGAAHVLGVDGGFRRFEGTSAENVVSAKGHGVHPVSVALQGAAEDPLEAKPPAQRRMGRTEPGCAGHTRPTGLQGPTLNFPNPLP